MQRLVKNRELAEARRALAALAERVPTVRVAADTRIHQSQISRLFRGQFKRVSSNVRRLLVYAATPKRQRAPAAGPAPDAKQAVIRAALQTWDTTPEGGEGAGAPTKSRTGDAVRRLAATRRRRR